MVVNCLKLPIKIRSIKSLTTITHKMIVVFIFCNDFHDLFRYQFGHWLLMSSVIDFDSILAPLGIKFHVFFAIDVSLFSKLYVYRFWRKMYPKDRYSASSFSLLFPSCSAGFFFEGALAHLNSLLVPCWAFWVPFWIHFESLYHKKTSLSSPRAVKHL